MKSKVAWSEQVEDYVRGKAPDPRRALWREIKALTRWDGRDDPPRVRHLDDKLTGYCRLRVDRHRVIFREAFEGGERIVKCVFAGPRSTVYEAFAEIMLDELAD